MKKTILLAALAVTTLAGCKMAANLYYDKHPDKLAGKCATNYPIKTDSVSHDSTSHTQAITSHTDTTKGAKPAPVRFNCDSAQAAARAAGYSDGIFSVQCPDCPPSTHTVDKIHDTVHHWHSTTVTKESTAEAASVRALLEKERKEGIATQKSEYFYKRSSIILLVLLVISVVLHFIRSKL